MSIKKAIKKFKKNHKIHPSILELFPIGKKEINDFFSKSKTIWRYEIIDKDGNILTKHRLIDYDSSGIMIYIYNEIDIFILTTEEKLDVAKFTLSRLRKTYKD